MQECTVGRRAAGRRLAARGQERRCGQHRRFGDLEEITVTAQKVKENLQRTPVSDTVVTADTIDRIHMTDITEVAGVAPNVFANNGFSGSSAGANFFIRGIGQEDFISTSDPGVGLFVDGVY